MGCMNPIEKTNNERLRDLIEGAGISQPAALTIFNQGLGPAAYSIDAWKAFLVKPDAKKFRPLNTKLLNHAEKVFAKAIKRLDNGVQVPYN